MDSGAVNKTNGTGADDARAAALVEFRMMQEEISQLRADKVKLQRDLQIAEDRVVLVLDERNRFRKEANLYQASLHELIASIENIGVLADNAMSLRALVKNTLAKVDGGDNNNEEVEK